jgi:hypothetical protein
MSTATGETTFTAVEGTGSVDVEIPLEQSTLLSGDVVVYETLLANGETVLEHRELDNSEQTISLIRPRIATMASDASDSDHSLLQDAEARLIDVVSYTNLIPNEEYLLTGTLMKKEVDEEGAIHAVEFNVNEETPLTSTVTFTPQSASGSTEVPFLFDASEIEPGTELVVFERLIKDDTTIAEHEDPSDENQTICVIAEPEEPLEPDHIESPVLPEESSPTDHSGFFAKTGSALLPFIIGAGVLFCVAILVMAIAYRQHRKAQAVTAAIAHNMRGPSKSS